jgi:hypothetical protein
VGRDGQARPHDGADHREDGGGEDGERQVHRRRLVALRGLAHLVLQPLRAGGADAIHHPVEEHRLGAAVAAAKAAAGGRGRARRLHGMEQRVQLARHRVHAGALEEDHGVAVHDHALLHLHALGLDALRRHLGGAADGLPHRGIARGVAVTDDLDDAAALPERPCRRGWP